MVKVLFGLGILITVGAPVLWLLGIRTMFDMVFFELIAICAFTSAWILASVHNAVRDRVLAIYALSLAFVCIPFIPGIRGIPRRIPIYRLIWREHYREHEVGA